MTAKRDPLIVTMPDRRTVYQERQKMLWEQLLSQNPTNKDLLEVIHTMESLAGHAYNELLKRKPTNTELVACLHCKHGGVTEEAGKLLLNSNPTDSDLAQLVNWADDDTAEKAWQDLLRVSKRRGGTIRPLREIIESSCHNVAGYHNKRKYRVLAAEALLEQTPIINSDLLCIMQHCGEKLARKAISMFVGPKTSNAELCEVLEKVDDDYAVMRAMAVLLTRTPSNDELVVIISTTRRSNCYKLREEALQRLLQNNPTMQQLEKIILRTEKEIADQAWKKFLEASPPEEELARMMCSSADRANDAAEEIFEYVPQPNIKTLREIIQLAAIVYRERAAELLLKRSRVSEEDLLLIHEHVSSLRGEVQKRMPKKSVADIMQELRRLDVRV